MARHPELLIPASSLEVLKTAVIFGADAVYLAGNSFGMRAAPSNFNFEQLKTAVDYAHSKNVKIYLTCNILARNDELAVLPEALYANDITALFGFPGPDFYSTDYFPLIPWFFLYVTGWFLYRIFERRGWLGIFSKPRVPVLGFVGRHTLPIYMAHQPVIYAVLTVVFSILK